MNRRSYGTQHLKFLLAGVVLVMLLNAALPRGAHAPQPVDSPPPPRAFQEAALRPENLPASKITESVLPPRWTYAPEPYGPPAPEPLPWRRYAVPVSTPPGKPTVTIVIDDLGVARSLSEEVLMLPAPLTLAFLPYAAGVGAMVEDARTRGHEIMVHFPMEPMNPDLDTGPIVLTTEERPDAFDAMLEAGLSVFGGYVGMNNHMGSRLTQDQVAMDRLMAALKRRGLLFLDSRTIAASVADKTAAAHGVPHAVRDVFLDDDSSAEAVHAALEQTERIAREYGHAIAIGHPKPNTIAALQAWLPTLAEKGITLVPVSAVVREEGAAASFPLSPEAGGKAGG